MNADDYFAIQNLLFRYARLLDAGDYDGVAQLFARARVYMPGETVPVADRDPPRIAAMFREWTRIYPETGTPRTRHVTTNVSIEPDGPDRARAYSYVIVFQGLPGFPLQPVIGGAYDDAFMRIDGAWHFVERREEMDLFGDLSRHLLQPYGPEQVRP